MEKMLKSAGEKVLEMARQIKVEAEAYLLHNRELSIEVINGQVDTLKQAEEMGLGVRVINNGRIGFAFTSDLSDQAIKGILEDAVNISAYTEKDQYNILPQGRFNYQAMQIYDDDINRVSLEEKIAVAREAESAARSLDPRVSIVERAGYEDTEYTAVVMNTHGVCGSARANLCGSYIFLVAEENGDAQNGFSMMLNRRIKELDPQAIGREAAQDALRSLNARTIGTARMPCIMEPYVATRFLSIIAATVDADAVQKGKSMFAGKEGQVMASAAVSLYDDALFEYGVASFPFDGEGVPSQRNMVIEDGILNGFLYDTYTAAKAGKVSTGNGQRASFRGLPGVGTTNFMMKPGSRTPAQLIADIEKGFYITEVMGMHTANPISGDFSVGAAGLMIENGQLTYAVRGMTIAGNLADFLRDIDAAGNNLRFYGGKASPTIRLKSLSIGGE